METREINLSSLKNKRNCFKRERVTLFISVARRNSFFISLAHRFIVKSRNPMLKSNFQQVGEKKIEFIRGGEKKIFFYGIIFSKIHHKFVNFFFFIMSFVWYVCVCVCEERPFNSLRLWTHESPLRNKNEILRSVNSSCNYFCYWFSQTP